MLDILSYLVSIGQIKNTQVGNGDYVNTKSCPWCGREKLDVYYKTSSFVCRRAKCGQAGKFEKYIMQVEQCSWKEASRKLNGQRRFDKTKLFELGNKRAVEVEKEDWLKPISIPKHYEEINKSHVDAVNYLKHRRGVTLEQAKDADMMVSEEERRVIFPVEFGEEIVGYIARDYTDDSEKKVLNSKGKFRRMMMYNFMRVHKIRPERIIVVESAFNALKCGLDRSVAILGVHMSPEQFGLLKDILPKEIYIFLDPGYDEDAAKIARMFRYSDTKVFIVRMPVVRKKNGDVIDAGDLNSEQVERVLSKYSISLDEYENETVARKTSLFGKSRQ